MRIAALFLWLIVPLGLWLAVALLGTPHLVVSYTFHDNGDVYNPRAHRHYITCTYWGWTGMHRVAAEHGQCPWVRFFKADDQ